MLHCSVQVLQVLLSAVAGADEDAVVGVSALSEIVVTATRREEDPANVPASLVARGVEGAMPCS